MSKLITSGSGFPGWSSPQRRLSPSTAYDCLNEKRCMFWADAPESVNEWDWVHGNEINVLLLLGTAPWIPMRWKMVSVAMTVRIYILCVSQASNVDLWRGATYWSKDILSSYWQIWDESQMQALQSCHLQKLCLYFVMVIYIFQQLLLFELRKSGAYCSLSWVLYETPLKQWRHISSHLSDPG